MNLATVVSIEVGAPIETIMLLRHSNASVAKLHMHNASVEEYTALQPINTKYDFFHPGKIQISHVIVIVNDHVYGVFRIEGVEAVGTSNLLASPEYQAFDAGVPIRQCRLFNIVRVVSITEGQAVFGWEGREIIPVLRQGVGFFDEVSVGNAAEGIRREDIETIFDNHVRESLSDNIETRRTRLEAANIRPARILVSSYVYNRNPDVVAETLMAANGVCQNCNKPAPFIRRANGSPYLEVHHRTPLSEGGDDSVANAIALCPNCHRQAHYA